MVGYFVARDSKYQPITWEIHGIFLLKKTPYNFNVNIDRTVRCDFLIKKFDFVSCKIIDIQVPKDKKLNEEQKSFLSKMFVRFYELNFNFSYILKISKMLFLFWKAWCEKSMRSIVLCEWDAWSWSIFSVSKP